MTYIISSKVEPKEVPKGQIDCHRITITEDGINKFEFEHEFLPDYVDYDIGHWKGYPGGEDRRRRLSLASNVWQVGWYLPPYKFGSPEKYDLTNHILENKSQLENYVPRLLALSMYIKAEREKFDIFDTHVIVPVPNFCLDDNSGAVSISNELAEIMREKGARIIFKENLLKKTMDIEAKHMIPSEKEEFYSKHTLYEIHEDFAGMGYLRGKKVMLVDDVITHGYAVEQCLKALSNQGAEDLCFYSVATTKMRTRPW